jgi:sodium/potassium-transporting ATPase subunit alpha
MGFPIYSLFGLATWTGTHKPPRGDFSDGIGCKNTYKNDCAYFNANFMNNNADSCIEDMENSNIEEWEFNWLTNPDGEYDLRKAFIYCDTLTGKWSPKIAFSPCSKENYYSPITKYTACYSVEALKYA